VVPQLLKVELLPPRYDPPRHRRRVHRVREVVVLLLHAGSLNLRAAVFVVLGVSKVSPPCSHPQVSGAAAGLPMRGKRYTP
jgi:hypothetical protein